MKLAPSATCGLWRFLAASLALHLLLLLTLRADVRPLQGGRPSLAVKVALSTPGQQAKAQERTGSERGLRRPALPKPTAAPARNYTKPNPDEVAPLTQGNRELPQSIRPGTGGDAIVAEAAVPNSSPRDGATIDAARQYVLLLVPEARRLKRYPALARERGWEGTTEIAIRLGRGQSVPALAVSRSSGFPILDEQALAMIGHAVRIVVVPDLLQGKDLEIPVPIRFGLDD